MNRQIIVIKHFCSEKIYFLSNKVAFRYSKLVPPMISVKFLKIFITLVKLISLNIPITPF